jgi:histidine triad (HIT) family protein
MKKDDCIFCKVIEGKIPSQIVYQDEKVTAFRDIHPVAPTHIVIVPAQHIDSLNEATIGDENSLGHMFTVARMLAEQEGLQESGYRLVINTGTGAGQTVFHFHMHLIGGKTLSTRMC